MRSQKANEISKTAIGIHISIVIRPLTTAASCNGSNATSNTDAITPSHASDVGIIRPRSRSQQKSVLPTAKNVAARFTFQVLTLMRSPASAYELPASPTVPASVASHKSPSVANIGADQKSVV